MPIKRKMQTDCASLDNGCSKCHRAFNFENIEDVANTEYIYTDFSSVQYVCMGCHKGPRRRPRRRKKTDRVTRPAATAEEVIYSSYLAWINETRQLSQQRSQQEAAKAKRAQVREAAKAKKAKARKGARGKGRGKGKGKGKGQLVGNGNGVTVRSGRRRQPEIYQENKTLNDCLRALLGLKPKSKLRPWGASRWTPLPCLLSRTPGMMKPGMTKEQVMSNPRTAARETAAWRAARILELQAELKAAAERKNAPGRNKRPSPSLSNPAPASSKRPRSRRHMRLRESLVPCNVQTIAWPAGSVLPQCSPQPHQCCALIYGEGIHPQCPNQGIHTRGKQLLCEGHVLALLEDKKKRKEIEAQKEKNKVEDLAQQAPIRQLLRTEGVRIDDSRLLTKAALMAFAKDNNLAFPRLGDKKFKESKDNVFEFIYLTSVARGQQPTLKEAAATAATTMAGRWRGERQRGSETWHDRLPIAGPGIWHGTTARWGWAWRKYPYSAQFECPAGCPPRWYGEYMELKGLTQHQVEAEAKRFVTCPPLLLPVPVSSLCLVGVLSACWLRGHLVPTPFFGCWLFTCAAPPPSSSSSRLGLELPARHTIRYQETFLPEKIVGNTSTRRCVLRRKLDKRALPAMRRGRASGRRREAREKRQRKAAAKKAAEAKNTAAKAKQAAKERRKAAKKAAKKAATRTYLCHECNKLCTTTRPKRLPTDRDFCHGAHRRAFNNRRRTPEYRTAANRKAYVNILAAEAEAEAAAAPAPAAAAPAAAYPKKRKRWWTNAEDAAAEPMRKRRRTRSRSIAGRASASVSTSTSDSSPISTPDANQRRRRKGKKRKRTGGTNADNEAAFPSGFTLAGRHCNTLISLDIREPAGRKRKRRKILEEADEATAIALPSAAIVALAIAAVFAAAAVAFHCY